MKVLLVGDDYIGSDLIESAFASWREKGCELVSYDWLLGSVEKLQNVNRILEEKGPEAIMPPADLFTLIEDADILIIQFLPLGRSLIDSAKKLKVVGILRAGYENVDVDYLSSKGIMFFNNPGRNADAVSDYAIGMMLAEARNIARGHMSLKQGEWRREYVNSSYIPDLPGRVVGIVGFGQIGQLVAKKLSGFEMRILAYDPYVSNGVADTLNVQLTDLATLLEESDFVTLHARLTEDNRHMIGADELALMKPTAFLINTARSGLIDEKALYEALRERKIGGAALDVFDQEPTGKDYPLVTLDNCTVTPHIAGTTNDALVKAPYKLARELEKLFYGDEPRSWVNKGKVQLIKLNS
ncbi:2-hydroxyacid dehydrogenase [Acetomicrobium sp.]|uniref:2-hydroxyacid dehydrogenase n=1 Tax=Acetomicrobium sp. TaxID=1872099 RepID=UPI002871EC88|nr:2-hydroxyacid dehydrogenase [Acetomicrobium sp.]MDR9769333.1 2-hydroxyacid dehydrogenase [Acetomicrobium sp.]